MISTEVGRRAFNLHGQGIFVLRYGKTDAYIKELNKSIRALLPCKGVGYKIMIKPLESSQSISAMVGYCLKDSGEAHFDVRSHGFTANELSTGKQNHTGMVSTFNEEKKVLTNANMFLECLRFTRSRLHPIIPPIGVTVTYMLQTELYLLAPAFVTGTSKKMDMTKQTFYGI